MGYIDKEVAAAQRRIGDAVNGKGLQKAIRALQLKSQIRNSLEDAPARGSITAKRKLAKPTGVSAADRTEISRSFYTNVRELRSTDGLFTLQFRNVQKIVFSSGTDNFNDYDPA